MKLIQAGPCLLPAFDPSRSGRARRQPERLGVVDTGTAITAIDVQGVNRGDRRR